MFSIAKDEKRIPLIVENHLSRDAEEICKVRAKFRSINVLGNVVFINCYLYFEQIYLIFLFPFIIIMLDINFGNRHFGLVSIQIKGHN
jgi:hypothetical protein